MKIAKLSMIAFNMAPLQESHQANLLTLATYKRYKRFIRQPASAEKTSRQPKARPYVPDNTPKTATMANESLVAVRIQSIMIDSTRMFRGRFDEPKKTAKTS